MRDGTTQTIEARNNEAEAELHVSARECSVFDLFKIAPARRAFKTKDYLAR